MANQLLLISGRDEDRKFAEAASKLSEFPLTVEADYSKAIVLALNMARPMLFVDISSQEDFDRFREAITPVLAANPTKLSSNFIHLITTEKWEGAEEASKFNIFGHLILRNLAEPEQVGKIYGKIMSRAECGKNPCLSEILAKDSKIHTLSIATSDHKETIVLSIRDLLSQALGGEQSRLVEFVANAADELLMNAIYDAPAAATAKKDTLDRLTKVDLSGKRTVEVLLGVDEDHIGLSVIDRFGSLNKSKLLLHMLRSYRENEYKIDPTVAGAGIGLALTFKSGASLLFYSELGERTEATLLARNTKKWREFRTQFKFISVHVKAPKA